MEYYFEQLNPHSCKTYLFHLEGKNDATIVDPVLEHVGDYLQYLKDNNLKLTTIIETHTHADHISGAPSLKDHTDADLVMHHEAPAKCVTHKVHEGDTFTSSGIPVKVLETPGHTMDSITVILPDKILTGDALFLDEGGAGRDDLPGGDPKLHWESLQKIMALPEQLIVYPAHDYRNRPPSSLQHQKSSNPFLRQSSKKEYINYITDLKLGPADWMKDVLKANYACARDPNMAWIPVDASACEVKGTLQKGVNEQEIDGISPVELEDQLHSSQTPFLLDVRDPSELQGELGYIEGVKNIPIPELIANVRQLENVKDQEIVIICRSGGRATTAAQILKQMGFQKPVVLEGGMIAWRQRNQ